MERLNKPQHLASLTRKLTELDLNIMVSFPLPDIPQIKEGDNIGAMIVKSMEQLGGINEFDIYVVASKIVSKAEGRIVDLERINPSQEAFEIYHRIGERKSPELIQLILDQAKEYTVRNGVIVARHKELGFELTSAGVDRLDNRRAVLLPKNPDLSARRIREQVERLSGQHVAVITSDSEGRPDRKGAGAISIGVSGINPLREQKIIQDDGTIKTTSETIADMLAAQAALIMGQRGNMTPIVCIRGFPFQYNPEANLQSIIL